MSDYAGYAKLRLGRIHLWCPGCKRKMSNALRDEASDPPDAVLAHVYCERCSAGCKTDGISTYLDAQGRSLTREL